MSGRSLIAATTAAMAFLSVLGLTTAASASEGSTVTYSVGMRIGGFDPEVAKANGYEIRTDEQGRQYSVKLGEVGTQSQNGGRLYGDCGNSWVRVNGIGRRVARLETSWDVILPVVAFEWHITVIDTAGVSSQDWGPRPGPGSTHWQDSRDLPGMAVGTVDAQVTPTASKVQMNNGAWCYSGGPRDSGWISA
ncbi:hypothetical protein SAMN04488074_103321 [Lentzea albidocapillata subsp. violacea]|uniref:Uncharacterized protein n=1 Tax=Lentzea albidocapillata subsp. violacea TaxID=128104 RepID=A0A1G8WY98_9PSEU|nr:hypothetical protein [Lentzea albidocapillata]SDJ83046.1 hypothetical protein SAMN04488074_103321 [Lentzea albidocapillata subsp. violacea]